MAGGNECRSACLLNVTDLTGNKISINTVVFGHPAVLPSVYSGFLCRWDHFRSRIHRSPIKPHIMTISIINHTDGQISDEDLQQAIRAINRQIREDFEPYWGICAKMRLEGTSTDRPETVQVADMRGDAIIYLWNETDVENALGYHFQNNRGIPFGFVFTTLAQEVGESWTVTLSHEALELIGDPETNMLVMGPHPSENRDVFHWFEMCDAVQAQSYQIDGIAVSNFLLPLYFTGTRDVDEVGARNDFLGSVFDGKTLNSFGINPGGYIGFFDPQLGDHDTFSIKGDRIAAARLKIKSKAKEARRSVRYRDFDQREKLQAKEMKAAGIKMKPVYAKREDRPMQFASITGQNDTGTTAATGGNGLAKRPVVKKAAAKAPPRKVAQKKKVRNNSR
jgi:hypothetical protein